MSKIAERTTTGDKEEMKPQPLLIDIREVGTLLARSIASLKTDDIEGRIPRPLYLGGSKRWRRREILTWVRAGCPDRATWENTEQRTGQAVRS